MVYIGDLLSSCKFHRTLSACQVVGQGETKKDTAGEEPFVTGQYLRILYKFRVLTKDK